MLWTGFKGTGLEEQGLILICKRNDKQTLFKELCWKKNELFAIKIIFTGVYSLFLLLY
jgi:hypothetical protein